MLQPLANTFIALSVLILSGLFSSHQVIADDGPYVFYSDNKQQLKVQWVCNSQPVEKIQPINQVIKPVCGYSRDITLRQHKAVDPKVQFTADSLAVLSDIHGQYGVMTTLLQANAIVDADFNWSFGSGHLVVVGDVMDRGPQVTEIFWWLYQLEQQAEAAGGNEL